MKNQSVFVKIFISFLVFLILPVTVYFYIVRTNIISRFKTNIIATNISQLKHLQENFENILFDIESTAIRIFSDQNEAWINREEKFIISGRNIADIKKSLDIETYLLNTGKTNNNVETIYYYIENADVTFTSNMQLLRINDYKDEEWYFTYNDLKSQHDGSTYTLSNKWISNDSEIYYIYLLTPLGSNINGAIIIKLNVDKVANAITETAGTRTYILDKTQNIVLKDKTAVKQGKRLDESLAEKVLQAKTTTGVFNVKENGERKILCFVKSTSNGFNYTSLNDEKTIMEVVGSVQAILIFVTAMLIVLGLALSFAISKWLYSPVSEMLKSIKQSDLFEKANEKNEYSIITSTINKMIKREKSLGSILEINKRSSITNSVKKAFRDGFFISDSILYERFCVLKIELCTKYTLIQADIMNLIMTMLEKALTVSDTSNAYSYTHGEDIFVLVNFQKGLSDDWLDGYLKQIIKGFNDTLNISVSIGVSEYAENGQINDCVPEAEYAAKMMLFYGYNKIIKYSECIMAKTPEYFYPDGEIKGILDCIRNDQQNEVEIKIKEFINAVSRNTKNNYDNAIQIIYQFVSELLKFIIMNNVNINEVFAPDEHLYRTIHRVKTLSEMEKQIVKMSVTLITRFDELGLYGKRHFSDIIKLIDERYSDQSLSIELISDQLGLSYTHVRRIFKETAGKTIIDYITEKRINDAKLLLKTTNKTILDISNSVGFTNPQSFVRAFKKCVGKTPSEFRKSL